MALPGFRTNKKFKRLVALLRMPEAHVLGHVQMIWETCYDQASAALGDVVDVELAAGWHGEPGALCEALKACGGGGIGLVEIDPNGVHVVHDFWDHAPRYVSERAKKNADREALGETISSLRAKAGALGAAKRWQKNGNSMANDSNLPSTCEVKMAICHQTRPVQYSTSTCISTCTSTNSTPPIIPLNGKKTKFAKAQKDAGGLDQEYIPQVHEVVEYAKSHWKREQQDGSAIHPDWSMTRGRVDRIINAPEVKMSKDQMASVLKKAIDIYLGKARKAYKAPQFFFGPGLKEDPDPWRPYARDAYHILNPEATNATTG